MTEDKTEKSSQPPAPVHSPQPQSTAPVHSPSPQPQSTAPVHSPSPQPQSTAPVHSPSPQPQSTAPVHSPQLTAHSPLPTAAKEQQSQLPRQEQLVVNPPTSTWSTTAGHPRSHSRLRSWPGSCPRMTLSIILVWIEHGHGVFSLRGRRICGETSCGSARTLMRAGAWTVAGAWTTGSFLLLLILLMLMLLLRLLVLMVMVRVISSFVSGWRRSAAAAARGVQGRATARTQSRRHVRIRRRCWIGGA